MTKLRTPLTELIGIEHPVVQTGMGWVAGARLVAATSNAGGLGILAAAAIYITGAAGVEAAEVVVGRDAPVGVATDRDRLVDVDGHDVAGLEHGFRLRAQVRQQVDEEVGHLGELTAGGQDDGLRLPGRPRGVGDQRHVFVDGGGRSTGGALTRFGESAPDVEHEDRQPDPGGPRRRRRRPCAA